MLAMDCTLQLNSEMMLSGSHADPEMRTFYICKIFITNVLTRKVDAAYAPLLAVLGKVKFAYILSTATVHSMIHPTFHTVRSRMHFQETVLQLRKMGKR